MATVNIYQAKTPLSELVDQVAQGEDSIIARNGKPVAPLNTLAQEKLPVPFGLMEGEIWIADDFNDPLPDKILTGFERR
jgi:prevent-host-death family protein